MPGVRAHLAGDGSVAARRWRGYSLVHVWANVAALTASAFAGGGAGLKALLRRQMQWRVGWLWYAVAIALPIALELATIALNVILGARAPDWSAVRPWPSILGMTALYAGCGTDRCCLKRRYR